jgi:hypothetical protein
MSTATQPAPEVKKRTVYLPFSPRALLREVFCRSLLIWLWRIEYLSDFWMWFASIVLSVVLFAWSAVRWSNINKDFESTAESHLDVNVEPVSGAFHGGLLIAISIFACFQVEALVFTRPLWVQVLTFVILFVPILLYAMGIAWDSVRRPSPVKGWDTQADAFLPLSQKISSSLPEVLAVDNNDQAILKLEADRDSMVRRVEAFTLEGALLGALAFSAFVSIAAADSIREDSMGQLRADAWTSLRCLLGLDWFCLVNPVGDLLKRDRLLCLVSVLALIASLFFCR